MWLPAVCRKMDIPYCIVKSKSRLGALVHQKTATALALTSVRSEVRPAPPPPRPALLRQHPAPARSPASSPLFALALLFSPPPSSPPLLPSSPLPAPPRRQPKPSPRRTARRLPPAACRPLTPASPLSAAALQDRHEFSQLVTAIRQQYNENAKAIERSWGGGIMGIKSQAATAKHEKALAKELAKKAMM